MQWKIARPGKLADRINRWALGWGFPFLAWFAPRAPRWFLFANARWIIAVVMGLHYRPKRAIARNLGRILGRDPESRAVRRAVRRMLRHFAFYWVDLFHFAQLPPEVARANIASVSGMERLERLRETGRPVLLLTAHLGNWELAGVLCGQRDWPVSVVYVEDQFAEAESFRSSLRRGSGVEEIPIRPREPFASLPVLRALREGRMVALQGDRDFDEQGKEALFFGARVKFPPGPFYLARITEAVVLPTFLTYTSDYRFEIVFGEPIEVSREIEREAAVEAALARWAAVLEREVARHPTQWYTFYDFWPAEKPAPASA